MGSSRVKINCDTLQTSADIEIVSECYLNSKHDVIFGRYGTCKCFMRHVNVSCGRIQKKLSYNFKCRNLFSQMHLRSIYDSFNFINA